MTQVEFFTDWGFPALILAAGVTFTFLGLVIAIAILKDVFNS